jgi:predicted secreted protein
MQVGTADYVAPASPPAEPGAPGTMTFRFRAATAGTATLEFAYRRPFEMNVAPAKTVRYDVTVR